MDITFNFFFSRYGEITYSVCVLGSILRMDARARERIVMRAHRASFVCTHIHAFSFHLIILKITIVVFQGTEETAMNLKAITHTHTHHVTFFS